MLGGRAHRALAAQAALVPAPTYAWDFQKGIPSNWTFSRGNTAWQFGGDTFLGSVGSSTPVIDYDPVTGAPYGYRCDPQTVNRVIRSREFANAAWTKTNCTCTANVVGIDGASNTGHTMVATSANGKVNRSTTLSSANYTGSVYIKRKTGTGTIQISMNNGTNTTDVTSSINSTSWTKVQMTRNGSNPNFAIILVTSGDEIYIDQASVESGTFAGPPIVTTSAAVTRDWDNLSCDTPALFGYDNTTQRGTILIEALPLISSNASDFPWVFSLEDAARNNLIGMYLDLNSGSKLRLLTRRVSGTGDVGVDALLAESAMTPFRVAVAFTPTQIRWAKNGVSQTAATPTDLGTYTKLKIGYGDAYFHGWFRRFVFWDFPLTDTHLRQATARPFYAS